MSDVADNPPAGADAADAAEMALRQELELHPDDAAGHQVYASFLAKRERFDEASRHFLKAIELAPASAGLRRQYGEFLVTRRHFADAVEQFWAGVRQRPNDAQLLCDLGNGLVSAKRADEAVPILRQAIRLLPGDAALRSNLGLAYSEVGRFEEAEASFLEALRISPSFAPGHNNLAILYIMMGNHRAALACAEMALALKPDYPQARQNRALALLSLGYFERGWEDYDWVAYGLKLPADPWPTWRGEPLAGKRILLTTLQGLGDVLHFIRYAALLKEAGAHVTVAAPMPLMDVLESVPGVDEVVAQDAAPAADVCMPVAGLPRAFRTRLESIPRDVPYMSASPERVARWRQVLGEAAGEKRVGIVWQGNAKHQWDRFRSMRLAEFEPLAHVRGIQLISLQRGAGVEQIEAFQRATGGKVLVPTDGEQRSPDDMADSAAIMSLLDLIITVDSAPAHLAGALGRPVWLLLAQAADWRWMTETETTPWYPTMTLFRQKRVGRREEVMEKVSCRLRAFAGC